MNQFHKFFTCDARSSAETYFGLYMANSVTLNLTARRLAESQQSLGQARLLLNLYRQQEDNLIAENERLQRQVDALTRKVGSVPQRRKNRPENR